MKLLGKKLLILVADGTNQPELESLSTQFECEGAMTYTTSPHQYLTVETTDGAARGRDVLIDLPIDSITVTDFDALVVPDGKMGVDAIKQSARARSLIWSFHQAGIALFASGAAVEALHESNVLSPAVMVREQGQGLGQFIDEAVMLLSEQPRGGYMLADQAASVGAYRSTM